MSCTVLVLSLGPALLAGWVWRERRRWQYEAKRRIENDRLRVQLDRLRTAMSIDEEIDSLTDDELRDRMRNSPYIRK
ncbi:MAG: hypothetical protein MI923_27320 [Phycisphaerales bacterium]|nr:hypothetical protein [Phycisphaerales bacterium]